MTRIRRQVDRSLALLGAAAAIGAMALSGCVDQPLVALELRSLGGTSASGQGGNRSDVGGNGNLSGGAGGIHSDDSCQLGAMCGVGSGSVCCPGQSCVNGACVIASCAIIGDDCSESSECCSGKCSGNKCDFEVNCTPAGSACVGCCSATCAYYANAAEARCTAVAGCQPLGENCSSDSDCCSGDCTQHVCSPVKRCLMSGETHCDDGGGSCCGGLSCQLGSAFTSRCVPLRCSENYEECSHDEACCGFGAGNGDVSCQWKADLRKRSCIRSCAQTDSPCGLGGTCCDGNTCAGGICVRSTNGSGGMTGAGGATGANVAGSGGSAGGDNTSDVSPFNG